MKKQLFFVILCFLLGSNYLVYSQDVIFKENGEEVKSKVLEVGKTEVTFKNFDDPEFSTFTMRVSDIKKIRFEDGTEKVFRKNLVNSYIGLSLFTAFPVGEFAGQSGYAKYGSGLMLDAGIYLVKNFGITIGIGGFQNYMDTNEIIKKYESSTGQNDFDFYRPHWNTGYFMIGPLYSVKMGKKFAMDFKLMAGPMRVKKPAYSHHYRSTVDYNYDYGEGKGTEIGMVTGIAFRYHFTKRVGLRLGIDYMYGRTRIEYTVNTSEPGSTAGTFMIREQRNSLSQRISVVKMEIGFLFLFKR